MVRGWRCWYDIGDHKYLSTILMVIIFDIKYSLWQLWYFPQISLINKYSLWQFWWFPQISLIYKYSLWQLWWFPQISVITNIFPQHCWWFPLISLIRNIICDNYGDFLRYLWSQRLSHLLTGSSALTVSTCVKRVASYSPSILRFAKCICRNCKLYLYKLQIVFVQIAKCF